MPYAIMCNHVNYNYVIGIRKIKYADIYNDEQFHEPCRFYTHCIKLYSIIHVKPTLCTVLYGKNYIHSITFAQFSNHTISYYITWWYDIAIGMADAIIWVQRTANGTRPIGRDTRVHGNIRCIIAQSVKVID